MKLPDAFQDKMKRLLGKEYDAWLASFSEERTCGLRVNRARISAEAFLEKAPFRLERIPWTDNGFYYDPADAVTRHPYYYAGLYYIQEPSAMAPASRIPIEPGDRVLDLCAAPGGKSTELAARLGGSGLLVSNDISRSRAIGLLKNLELFGAGNILVASESPEQLAERFPAYFHKILVDAPCSGEGMFRRDPSMIKSWEERGPKEYVPLQREILRHAAAMLMPGGMLLYSTCTFDPEEDEGNIAWLLETCPKLHLIPMRDAEHFSEGTLPGTARIWPHRVRGEGHFLALLQKDGACTAPPPAQAVRQPRMPEEMREFLSHAAPEVLAGKRIEIRADKAYALPADFPDVKGLSFLRTGLFLGENKKKRFEPSQALAMALSAEQFDSTADFAAEDPRIMKYLRGETVEAETAGKGWTLVCADGFPLGWAKADRGVLKNKYCAGWRMR